MDTAAIEANLMATFRVPFPRDPAQREALFARAAARLARHGSYQGTAEAGSFQGRTPLGIIAGTYHACADSGMLEIKLTRKPRLIPTSLVEHELRRLMTHIA